MAATSQPWRALVFALLLAYAGAATAAVATHWRFEDAGSYWDAGLRLQAGEPLYFRSANPSDSALYWYSPWFAALWIPLTVLPRTAVMLGWGAVQFVALAYLLWPSGRPASIALSLVLLPDLLRTASTGNVQVPMLALLMLGLSSKWAPFAIGLSASLKVWPILFIVLCDRRQALIAFGVAAVLAIPIVFFDLSAYPVREIATPLPLPLMWLVALGGLGLLRTRYRALGASIAAMFANPSWSPGTLGYLAVARRANPQEVVTWSGARTPSHGGERVT